MIKIKGVTFQVSGEFRPLSEFKKRICLLYKIPVLRHYFYEANFMVKAGASIGLSDMISLADHPFLITFIYKWPANWAIGAKSVSAIPEPFIKDRHFNSIIIFSRASQEGDKL